MCFVKLKELKDTYDYKNGLVVYDNSSLQVRLEPFIFFKSFEYVDVDLLDRFVCDVYVGDLSDIPLILLI